MSTIGLNWFSFTTPKEVITSTTSGTSNINTAFDVIRSLDKAQGIAVIASSLIGLLLILGLFWLLARLGGVLSFIGVSLHSMFITWIHIMAFVGAIYIAAVYFGGSSSLLVEVRTLMEHFVLSGVLHGRKLQEQIWALALRLMKY